MKRKKSQPKRKLFAMRKKKEKQLKKKRISENQRRVSEYLIQFCMHFIINFQISEKGHTCFFFWYTKNLLKKLVMIYLLQTFWKINIKSAYIFRSFPYVVIRHLLTCQHVNIFSQKHVIKIRFRNKNPIFVVIIHLFASFLTRKYNLILFRAHIDTIKMLQGSIHHAKTPFFVVYRNRNDFHPLDSVGEAHLPNWYFLLFFRPENTAQSSSEPRSTRSKGYKLLFPFLGPQFFAFFRDVNAFYLHWATVGEVHLFNW